MNEISIEYLHKTAEQINMISSLLAGFSIAIVANILISESKDRLIKNILLFATTSASLFLITLFSMTSIIIRTTEGYPIKVSGDDLMFLRLVGFVSFLIGIISLVSMSSV